MLSTEPQTREYSHPPAPNVTARSTINNKRNEHAMESPVPPVTVNSVDTIKQIVKHLLKNKGRNEEPSEQEINQAMEEFEKINKVLR